MPFPSHKGDFAGQHMSDHTRWGDDKRDLEKHNKKSTKKKGQLKPYVEAEKLVDSPHQTKQAGEHP